VLHADRSFAAEISWRHGREFITLLGGAAATWPLLAHAQQPAMPVIGFLYPQYQDTADLVLGPFREGLREQGYVEGRNLLIKYVLAQNQRERLPMMAAALVREQVAAIATVGDGATLAAKAATQSIPVIFNVGSDPIESRIVPSLNHPGGNLTGTTNLNTEVIEKRLELLHQVQPAASTIAYLTNSKGAGDANIKRAQRAAGVLGVRLLFVGVSRASDLEAAFATIIEQGARGLQIDTDPFLESVPVSAQIIALAQSWHELLVEAKSRGLKIAPEIAVGLGSVAG
jgi:putative ABC transport system substrate-binding protein